MNDIEGLEIPPEDILSLALKRVLPAMYPNTTFLWNDQEYDAEGVADNMGLLPILAIQAQATARALDQGLAQLFQLYAAEGLEGGVTGVGFKLAKTVAIGGMLPFLIDSVEMAKGLTNREGAINLNTIYPPIEPSLADILDIRAALEETNAAGVNPE